MSKISEIYKYTSSRLRSINIQKWVVIGLLIGIFAGVSSIVLYFAINFFTFEMLTALSGYTAPVPAAEGGTVVAQMHIVRPILIPVSTVIGGLISGFIVYKFAPETQGAGIDDAIDAYHNRNGKIRKRVSFIKLISSAILIGSGGSAGREGPTAQITAGFGSLVGDLFHLNDHDRRIAIAAGIGAGTGSIFMAPLGGALLSTEILYRKDFEVEAILPSIIASVVGYAIYGYMFNYQPIFKIEPGIHVGFYDPVSLLIYLALGIVAGLAGIGYVRIFYGMQHLFVSLKSVPNFVKPAIGALIMGVIAVFFPQILGIGYGWVQQVFYNNLALLPLWLLATLFFLKIIATSLTVSSGGPGGVFAPGIVSGAFLGATMGVLVHSIFPLINVIEVTIVTMIAFFGGVSKAPISMIIMGTEMTSSYALILPLMLSTTLAYYITGYKNAIFKAQVLNRAHSQAHRLEYERPIMEEISVEEAMNQEYRYVSPDALLSTVIDALKASKTHSLVVKKDGTLEGYISIEHIKDNTDLDNTTVADVMVHNAPIIKKTENIHVALDRLIKNPAGKLIVVDETQNDRVVGTIGLAEIAKTYNRVIRKIKQQQREEELE